MSLNNQSVAVVTGAASGIGRALARHLAAEKIAAVAVCDVNEAGLNKTAQLLEKSGVEVSKHIVNVADRREMENLVKEIIERHGRVTHLINNAGVSLFGDIEEVSLEDIEWVMNINFWGVVYGVKTFLPILREQPAAHIVNVSSVFGLVALPGQAAYCASKYAVRAFTESLRHELEETNILVSSVHPGGIRTAIADSGRLGAFASDRARRAIVEMFNRELTPTSPEAAAVAIIRGIKQRKKRILIGNDAYQMNFIARLFPVNYLRVMNFLSGGKLRKIRQAAKKHD